MTTTHPGPEYATILTEIEAPIGRLVLARPDELNPLSKLSLEEIEMAARAFDARKDVRAVVVSGAGRAFSAGADLAMFGGDEHDLHEAADAGRLMADAVEQMSAVTIAAIHGWCVGGALVLAAACDLRIAAEGTMFSIPEIDLGIPLAWGGVPRLVREIGPARTKDLVMTCRRFDAAEAHSIGFVNRVVTKDRLLAEAGDLARAIAAKARHAITSTKRHVDAVTAQMVGTARAWSDADGLVAAFNDPESATARAAYLAAHQRT